MEQLWKTAEQYSNLHDKTSSSFVKLVHIASLIVLTPETDI